MDSFSRRRSGGRSQRGAFGPSDTAWTRARVRPVDCLGRSFLSCARRHVYLAGAAPCGGLGNLQRGGLGLPDVVCKYRCAHHRFFWGTWVASVQGIYGAFGALGGSAINAAVGPKCGVFWLWSRFYSDGRTPSFSRRRALGLPSQNALGRERDIQYPAAYALTDYSAPAGRRIEIGDAALAAVRSGGRFPPDDVEGFVRVLEEIYSLMSERSADGAIVLKKARKASARGFAKSGRCRATDASAAA